MNVSARLLADVGGTHARFATAGRSGCLERIEILPCADYPRIGDAIGAYLGRHRIPALAEACLAVAGPADQDLVDLPNNHWAFSRRELEASLGAPLTVINDFTAQALSLDRLREDDLSWFGIPRPSGRGIRAVVGPGTGLGVAIQMSGGEVVPSEGGHVGFAPTTDHQIALLRVLLTRYRRISVERLVSGPGLENLYWANDQLSPEDRGGTPVERSAPEIAELAARGEALALRTVEDFFDILAAFAGDLALVSWATAGVYLSGGVMRKLRGFFDPRRFRARFEDKGRFTRFCETVPIAWITFEHPGLLGCLSSLEGLAAGEGACPDSVGRG